MVYWFDGLLVRWLMLVVDVVVISEMDYFVSCAGAVS